MSLRVEVKEDCRIEIMRMYGTQAHFLSFANAQDAIHVIRYFLKRDLAQAKRDRFMPEIEKEAREAFKKLQEEFNAENKNETAGIARSRA